MAISSQGRQGCLRMVQRLIGHLEQGALRRAGCIVQPKRNMARVCCFSKSKCWHRGGSMPKFKERVCLNPECAATYLPTGPAQKYCADCIPIMNKIRDRKKVDRYRERKGVKVGVGSGNAQGNGKEHHSYKCGITGFQWRKLEALTSWTCSHCGKNLLHTIARGYTYHWVVHHIDHDRSNNDLENLELLCKQCHAKHHLGKTAIKV